GGSVPVIIGGSVPVIIGGSVPVIIGGSVPVIIGSVPGDGVGCGTVPLSKLSAFSSGSRPSRKISGTALGIVPTPCDATQNY
ncbi:MULTISPECIES: hypothetical protein, partial [unclassified Microcoleus]|uniref:hypothetical protein n=1 Tax=unclassified Microcoleus TaxID=2642155 RepID=UPI002FD47886